MLRIAHPRLAASVVSLGVGLAALAVTPRVGRLERIDRQVFGMLSGKGDAVVGTGSPDDPRRIEEFEVPDAVPPAELLVLDDDPKGFFESVPPPPTDVAVVLARLHARGAQRFAWGYPLQWEAPDTLAIEALRAVMDRFDGAVLGLPLKDSTAGDPLAAPFLPVSVPLAQVGGDATELPVVNSVRGVVPELGGRRTFAGFTRLESEKQESERAYLLARWGDRVVFALPLALEMVRRGTAMDEVRVEVGSAIRIGADGPRIAIDFRGRVDLPAAAPEVLRFPATAVISDDLPEGFATGERPLYFGDGRLLGPKEDREWTEGLGFLDAAIRRAPRRVRLATVPRPEPNLELAGIVGLALLSGAALSARHIELRLLTGCTLFLLTGLVLAGLDRFAGVGPVSLAFLAVPAVALVVGELGRFSQRVEVVTAREPEAPSPEPNRPASGKRGRRRKRKR